MTVSVKTQVIIHSILYYVITVCVLICFVTGKYKYTDSVSDILPSLGWPTLEARSKEQGLVIFYNIVNKIPCKFAHVRANRESFRHSFFPATISDWNSLPLGIVEAETTDCFKSKYRSYQASEPEASA